MPVRTHTSHWPACLQVEGKSVKECASQAPECAGLRTSYFSCKRGQLDPRARIHGNKGYPAAAWGSGGSSGRAMLLQPRPCVLPRDVAAAAMRRQRGPREETAGIRKLAASM